MGVVRVRRVVTVNDDEDVVSANALFLTFKHSCPPEKTNKQTKQKTKTNKQNKTKQTNKTKQKTKTKRKRRRKKDGIFVCKR